MPSAAQLATAAGLVSDDAVRDELGALVLSGHLRHDPRRPGSIWIADPDQNGAANAINLFVASPSEHAEVAGAVATFFLGCHQPGWLQDSPVPLFISDRRLRGIKRPLPAVCDWALDSGGFTELSTHGTWDNGPTAQEYVDRIRRYQRQIGRLRWAAPQDWMCEPFIVAQTGLTVREHQWRTIDNLFDLRTLAPELPIIPVLQGFEVDDYLRCIDLYRAVGVDLTAEPLVGVGSVCRRQHTDEIGRVFTAICEAGVTRLHGFGVKAQGLKRYGHLLTSADSLAWSMQARREAPLSGCDGHINCANCRRYAYPWARQMQALMSSPTANATTEAAA
jgi:hypothetical protein